MMENSVGQGDTGMAMLIDEGWFEVMTTEEVAKRQSLSERYVRQLCESGTISAIKKYGRWWVRWDHYIEYAVRDIPF